MKGGSLKQQHYNNTLRNERTTFLNKRKVNKMLKIDFESVKDASFMKFSERMTRALFKNAFGEKSLALHQYINRDRSILEIIIDRKNFLTYKRHNPGFEVESHLEGIFFGMEGKAWGQ